jgi:hypothetical protein
LFPISSRAFFIDAKVMALEISPFLSFGLMGANSLRRGRGLTALQFFSFINVQ